MRENFDKLSKREDWADPNCPTSPNKFTIKRQQQLLEVLEQYGGERIPFSHFSNGIVKNPAKRNKYAFPVVFAHICGILKIDGDWLVKRKELVLGNRVFDRNEVHWL